MKAPIDIEIPGDLPGIWALGDWLSQVGHRLDDVTGALRRLSTEVQYSWQGQSVLGFQHAATQQAFAVEQIANFASDAADAFAAYADRIKRGRDSFADYAGAARSAGMKVVQEKYIRPPEPPSETEQGDVSAHAAWIAMQEHEDAVKLFNEIERLVNLWHQDTNEWINSHLVSLIGRLGDLTALERLLDVLNEGIDDMTILEELLNTAEQNLGSRLDDMYDKQRQLQDQYEVDRKDDRSGNPAREARGNEFTQADRKANRTAYEELAKNLELIEPGHTLLRAGGPAATAIGAAIDLSNGVSVSSVGASVVGGWAGGIAGAKAGAIAGAATIPVIGPGAAVAIPLLTVAGAVVGATGGEAAARSGWEAWVPLRTREAIDAGLHDEYHLRDAYDVRPRKPHR